MSRPVSRSLIRQILRSRVTVLVTVVSAVSSLLNAGFTPLTAAATALVAAVGGMEVGRQLTLPYFAPQVRVSVLVIVVVVIVGLVRTGHPAPACATVVVGGAWCAAALARLAIRAGSRPAASAATARP